MKTFGWYRGYMPDGEPVDEFVLGADRPADWPEGNGIRLCRATAEQAGKVEGEGDGPSLAYRGLQSCRDMLCNQFTPKYGENFDGYLDAMTDALTWMRWAERRIAYAKPTQPAATHHNVAVPEGYELVSALEMKRLRQRDKVEQMAVYRDSVWYWQGDGADVPESLSCPVIMAADTLRALLAPAATQQPVAWAHDVTGNAHVITNEVKEILAAAKSIYARNYNVPLYAAPVSPSREVEE